MKKRLCLGALSTLLAAALASAQIVRLDLRQMVERTDNAVMGTITGKEVTRIDHPTDGTELYYTTLQVEGQSIFNGEPITVGVTYPGGFVDDEQGVYNSEAPAADETQLGGKVVVFYKWSDNMGGDFAGNALYASHGGLFTTFTSRGQTIVQGRGDGYAVQRNSSLTTLETRIGEIRASLGK